MMIKDAAKLRNFSITIVISTEPRTKREGSGDLSEAKAFARGE